MASITQAIPQDRYVRINSVNIGDITVAGRSFGGLVFTQGKGWSPNGLVTDDDGKLLSGPMPADYLVVIHTAAQALKYFSSDSQEVAFADRYFSFITPAGDIPRTLTFARVEVKPNKDSDTLLVWKKYVDPGADSDSSDDSVLEGWFDGDVQVNSPYIEPPKDAFSRLSKGFVNYGSLCFIDDIKCSDVYAVAKANVAFNYKFLYSQSFSGTTPLEVTDDTLVSAATPKAFEAYLRKKSPDGLLGFCKVKGDDAISAQMPMALFAATDYNDVNTAPNPMYKEYPGEKATVFDGDEAMELDEINFNYNGRVQMNGPSAVAFYQRGRNDDGEDTAVYCNEIWLKSAVGNAVMELLLSTNRVDANPQGEALIYTVVDTVARQGLDNGAIEVGKPLTVAQRQRIIQCTGNTSAWETVQESGYWISIQIVQSDGSDGVTQKNDYKAVYKLVYSKGDSIKFVDGSHYLV